MIPHWRYPYFDMMGLAWSHDPESYAVSNIMILVVYVSKHIVMPSFKNVSNIATGMASHLWQVKDDDPYIKGYPGPSGWGLGCEANNLTLKRPHCWEAI
jgi:hypothetical protein